MSTETAIHPFERSGLGKAPFRYVGVVHQDISHGERVIGSIGGIPVTTRPGGTCDHCGTAIVNMFAIESADGKRSKVGCDCIQKVDKVAPIRNASKFAMDVKAAKKAREQQRIKAAIDAMPEAHGLRSQPSPTAWRAAEGETLYDHCKWMMKNAGHSGKLKTARIVELAMARRIDD